MSSFILDSTIQINPSPVVPVTQPQSEGSLKGRRILNNTDEINKIVEKCKETSSEMDKRAKKMLIVAAVGIAICSIGIIASIPIAVMAGPLAATLGVLLGAVAIGLPMAAYGIGTICDLDVYQSINNSKKEAAKDKDFLDWAELNQIKLEFSNISDCYEQYLKLRELSRNSRL